MTILLGTMIRISIGLSIHVYPICLIPIKHRDAQRKFQSHLNDYDSKVDVIWLVVCFYPSEK